MPVFGDSRSSELLQKTLVVYAEAAVVCTGMKKTLEEEDYWLN